jgi:DNA-directed RNA polymerase specialized sigma24 family protein
MSQLTELLGRIQAGDSEARDTLFAAAYTELHRMARARLRDGDCRPVTLSTSLAANIADGEGMILRVHEALEELEKADPRLAQVAQMRYFGGYSEQEIAETLDITERTVQRDWEKARLILAAALR